MTDEIALRTLLEKSSGATVLREMIGFAAERLMRLETETLCGAPPGERSTDRINQRKGYRDRDWKTRVGTVELVDPLRGSTPKLRRRSYSPSVLEPRRMAGEALTAVIKEADIQGTSTRSVDDLITALGMKGINESQVPPLQRDQRAGERVPGAADPHPDGPLAAAAPDRPRRRSVTSLASSQTWNPSLCASNDDGRITACRHPRNVGITNQPMK